MASFISNAFKTARSSSLALKLLGAILICSGTMVVIISVAQLSWYYLEDKKSINDSIDNIAASMLDPIAESLWNLDELQLTSQINSLLNMRHITFVSVQEIIQGEPIELLSTGAEKTTYDVSRLMELRYQGELIGYLFAAASLDEAKRKLVENAFIIISSQTIKTLLVSTFIIIILYYMVIRHLNKIANFTKNLSFNQLNKQLILDGRADARDELYQLVKTLNNMNTTLYNEWEMRQQANKQLQQERDFSSTLIESANMIICCLDPELNIVTMNSAGSKITHLAHSEMIGFSWIEIFVNPALQESVTQKLKSDKRMKDEIFEVSFRDHSTPHILQWTFVKFYEEETLKYHIGFGYDISELKRVESAIKQLNQELEEIVERRTRKLKESNAQLETAFAQLKETQQSLVEAEKMASLGSLVAGVAHEINTPIGISVTASSFLDELIQDFEKHVAEKKLSRNYIEHFISQQKDSSQMIQNNLQRASRLISSFKRVAVDQSSKAAYTFNARENLEQVITTLKHQLKFIDHNIHIDCEPTLEIYSYPGELTQIYTNLIQNSLIHGFEEDWQGEKKISIKVYQNESNQLVIDYQDTGKGIPKNILDKIFDPFVTTKRGSGGSGLGTHIIYNLVVQLMKGSIVCESDVGQGARFLIQLPLEDQPDKTEENN